MADLSQLQIQVNRDPESDAPRLAYAAAVKATDPDRAELIRLQIEVVEMRRQRTPAASRALHYSKARTLINKHGERWTKDITALGYVTDPILMRGFEKCR